MRDLLDFIGVDIIDILSLCFGALICCFSVLPIGLLYVTSCDGFNLMHLLEIKGVAPTNIFEG